MNYAQNSYRRLCRLCAMCLRFWFANSFFLVRCRVDSCVYLLCDLDDITSVTFSCDFATFSTDIINTTKNIEWSKVAADIQVMMNHTIVRTGEFVSETVWASDLFQATVISLLFLTAYWSIIYLDSSQPGVNPPSPFASVSRKKWDLLSSLKLFRHHPQFLRFQHQRQAHFHLNYLLGAVISVLLFFAIFFHVF